jgi:hypothetical protein
LRSLAHAAITAGYMESKTAFTLTLCNVFLYTSIIERRDSYSCEASEPLAFWRRFSLRAAFFARRALRSSFNFPCAALELFPPPPGGGGSALAFFVRLSSVVPLLSFPFVDFCADLASVRAPSHTYRNMVERRRPTTDSVQKFSSGGQVRTVWDSSHIQLFC